ncbi:MAG TPA: hypothetical protein PKA55_03810 [Rhodoblastus sp.]|nr:hypothetical protein [Rhodoblastus sp.]
MERNLPAFRFCRIPGDPLSSSGSIAVALVLFLAGSAQAQNLPAKASRAPGEAWPSQPTVSGAIAGSRAKAGKSLKARRKGVSGGGRRAPAANLISSRAPAAAPVALPAKDAGAPTPAEQLRADDKAGIENSERVSDEKLASIARSYCSHNLASAAEARIAGKRTALLELEARVERKSAELGKLVADARDWVERREKLRAAARDNLVEAYSKMRPEAAAQQIGAMSDEAAVSILMKLNARAASAIMNEMGADRGARLADKALRRSEAVAEAGKSGS